MTDISCSPVTVTEAFSDPGTTQVGSSKSKVVCPLPFASKVFVFSYLTQPGCWVGGRQQGERDTVREKMGEEKMREEKMGGK